MNKKFKKSLLKACLLVCYCVLFFLYFFYFCYIKTGAIIAKPPVIKKLPEAPIIEPEYNELYLNIKINGQPFTTSNQLPCVLQSKSQVLYFSETDLKNWRIKITGLPFIQFEGKKYYSIKTLLGVSYQLDATNMQLNITVPVSLFENTPIVIKNEIKTTFTPSSIGGFLNYDIYGLKEPGKPIHLNGFIEGGIFSSLGVGTTSYLLSNEKNVPPIRNLSTWTYDMPEKMTVLAIGDTITNSTKWSNSVYFGGIKLSKSYDSQPNYRTDYLPSLDGLAVLPSVVNLYINNALTSQSTVGMGSFNISQIPLIDGKGNLKLVVTDLLGRQSVIETPYYASSKFIRAGLEEHALDIGFLRYNLSQANADYKDFATVFTQRIGLTNYANLHWRTELLKNQQLAGVEVDYLLPNAGIIDIATAASRNKNFETGETLLSSYEYSNDNFSFGLSAQVSSQNFFELGMTDKSTVPWLTSQAFVGFSIDNNSFGLNYTNQFFRGDTPKVSLISLGYNRTLPFGIVMNMSGLTNIGGVKTKGVFLLLSKSLGSMYDISSSFSRQDKTQQISAIFNKSIPAGIGYGYNIATKTGETEDKTGAIVYKNNIGTYSAAMEMTPTNIAYNASINGGIGFINDSFYLMRNVNDSFAMVTLPNFNDVGITVDNQLIAKTDKQGNALLPNIPAYQTTKIHIDAKDLPMNAKIDSADQYVTPYFRRGIVVNFPIKAYVSGTFTLVLPSGKFVPEGSEAFVGSNKTEPKTDKKNIKNKDNKDDTTSSEEKFPVGTEGQLYISGLQKHNVIHIDMAEGSCQFAFDLPDADLQPTHNTISDYGKITCE